MKRESEHIAKAREVARKQKAESNGKARRTVVDPWPEEQRGDAYEGEPPPEPPGTEPSYRPKLYTSAEFFQEDFRQEFLVRGAIIKNQPGVVGGGKKMLKSTNGIDLAVSLATGTNFLSYERFTVPKPVKVLLLNGESGDMTVQSTARRIAKARGIDNPGELNIVWGSQLPQLANAIHLQDLGNLLKTHAIEVLLVDPSYLCILSGAGPDGPQASNVFEMGVIYSQFAKCCLDVGTTPLLFAHTKKDRTKEPPDLDDLAFAGIAEFVRQWILISRREVYEGDGIHKLWLSVGGSAGHSMLAHLDVDEGVMDDDFQGRKWEVTVTPYHQAKRDRKAGKDQAKAVQDSQDEMAVAGLIDNLTAQGEVATLNRVRNGSNISRDRTDKALERMRQQKLFEEFPTSVVSGRGKEQDALAYRRKGAL